MTRHLLPRSETSLAHAVYGMILTIALLGELLHEDAGNAESALWLLGGGAVVMAAHVFSDAIGHVAATEEQLDRRVIVRIGSEEIAVVAGAVGAAVVMAAASVAEADNTNALIACIAFGLATLAYLSQRAASHHGLLRRIAAAMIAVGLGGAIVVLENLL